MSETKTHEYFNRDCSRWNILDFLNLCGIEPFDAKMDTYTKSLKNIICQEQGTQKERANELLGDYIQASNIFIRKWHDGGFLGYR